MPEAKCQAEGLRAMLRSLETELSATRQRAHEQALRIQVRRSDQRLQSACLTNATD